jgi:hypothetical protein
MKNAMLLTAALFASLALAPSTIAQDQAQPVVAPAKPVEPEHFYKLVFVVEQLNSEGKPVNSRSYTTTISTAPRASDRIRTGSKVPVATGTSEAPTQWQYLDVGVSFDVNDVREVGKQLALRVNADVSAIAPSPDSKLSQPVIRNNQWAALVLIPIGKATPIFTSDDVDGKGALQVVATVTLLQ